MCSSVLIERINCCYCYTDRRNIMPAVRKNWEREKSKAAYDPSLFATRLMSPMLLCD